MEAINFILFMIPRSVQFDPLAVLVMLFGFVALFIGYLYRLVPPFMLRSSSSDGVER